jgi:predicted RNase H-like HicB family nuclease
MKYLAIIEKTTTGYSGFIPDVDAAVIAAFPTLEKVQTALAEGLSLYAQEETLPEPKYKTLEDVPDLEDFSDLETVWVEPVAINPVSSLPKP